MFGVRQARADRRKNPFQFIARRKDGAVRRHTRKRTIGAVDQRVLKCLAGFIDEDRLCEILIGGEAEDRRAGDLEGADHRGPDGFKHGLRRPVG